MRYYTSRSGDTLLRIAVLFYFRHDLFEYLYLHNRKAIGDNMFVLAVNTKLAIPEPLAQELQHTAQAGETSKTLSSRYYGVSELYATIDAANNWPPALEAGQTYIVPPLVSQLELDAAKEAREQLSVQFDR